VKRASKKGFTLIEMLLAIDITMIISGLFISLIVSIRSSYYRSYNDVDCSDIAAMYAEALENTVLYDVQHGIDDEISINGSGILTNTAHTINFSAIENFNRADGGADGRKWDIRMICYFNERTGEFRYKIFFIDKYINTDYLHYVYEGSFWIPTYMPYQSHIVGQGDVVNPGERSDWDYNFPPTTTPAPSFPARITLADAGIVDADNNLTYGSGNSQGGFHTRVGTTSLGELRTDPSDSTTVTIPARSTVVTIDAP